MAGYPASRISGTTLVTTASVKHSGKVCSIFINRTLKNDRPSERRLCDAKLPSFK